MLLQRLSEYASRLNLPPTLYGKAPVRYIIELDGDGRLLSSEPTDTADPQSPRTRRGQRRSVPQVQRTSAIRPLLLADKADYALGYGSGGAHGDRVVASHDAFLELLERCAEETEETSVKAVLRFLRGRPLETLRLPADFDPGAIMTFRVEGVFPIDLPSVQVFWANENDPGRLQGVRLQCLVCGEEQPVLERLQGKIKGIPGGQPSGTSIVSANEEAFLSYGLTASLIAPTCASCGERFTKALNELLAADNSNLTLGGVAFVFWTREEVQFSIFKALADPQPDEVRVLLESVKKGGPAIAVDEDRFYAAALSGSGGRAVVRDWIDSNVAEVKERLALWFRRQAIVGAWGEEPRPLGIFALAASTVRDPADLGPPTSRDLLRAALTGAPVPWKLLQQAVRRCQVEQTGGSTAAGRDRVTRPRAALIKLVLLSQEPMLEEMLMVKLDPDSPSAAYHCGRLLAVLEEAQRAALPGIRSSIVDRFYGTASSAPASVFGRLLRGAQPHLSKLERDRPGAYFALQNRLEEIQAKLSLFPRILTLEEQGLFALGYYHQRAHDRSQIREVQERRKAEPEASVGVSSQILEEDSEEEEE